MMFALVRNYMRTTYLFYTLESVDRKKTLFHELGRESRDSGNVCISSHLAYDFQFTLRQLSHFFLHFILCTFQG